MTARPVGGWAGPGSGKGGAMTAPPFVVALRT
jgi:hypothetical protein